MVTRIQSIIIFCFAAFLSLSQNTPVDSLLKILPDQADTVKVQTLYKMCAYYQDWQPDSALKYCDVLYSLATKIKSVRWQANAINEMGYVRLVFHNYPKAIVHFREAAKLYESINNKKGAGNAYLNLGMAYSDIGEYAESISYNETALKYYNETNYYGGKGSAFNNIALIYMRQRAGDKALVYLDSAIACYKRAGEEFRLGNPIMNQALVQSDKNNYDEAIALYKRALEFFKRSNDLNKIAAIYNNIGNIYINLKQNQAAKTFLYESIHLKKELKDTIGLASSYLNLSTVYSIARDYRNMRPYLDTAHAYLVHVPLPEIKVYYQEELFKYYILKGNTDSALICFDQYKEVKDSLIKSDITRQLSDMSVKYDTEQIKRSGEEKEKQFEQERKIKNAFIIFSAFILLLLVILFVVWRKVRAYNKLIIRQREELIKTNHAVVLQKEIIEQKQKEILDSIHYAKRIQRTLLTNEKYIVKTLDRLRRSGRGDA